MSNQYGTSFMVAMSEDRIREMIADLPMLRPGFQSDILDKQKIYVFQDAAHYQRSRADMDIQPDNQICLFFGGAKSGPPDLPRSMTTNKVRAAENVHRQIIIVNRSVERSFLVKSVFFFAKRHRRHLFLLDAFKLRNRPDFIRSHIGEIREVVNLLEDETSVLCYLSRVKAMTFGAASYLRVSDYRQYFHPEVQAETGDTVVDAGVGPKPNTSKGFFKSVGKKGHVFAFEPSADNVAKIRKEVARIPQIELVEKGLSDRDEILEFTKEGAVSSTIEKRRDYVGETEKVPLTALDGFLSSDSRRIDLIKMDIEGAEQKAIAGARETIRAHRPKLQICLYHSHSDFLHIPVIVNELAPGYRFWVGHHTPFGNECVLYAKPRESVSPKRGF